MTTDKPKRTLEPLPGLYQHRDGDVYHLLLVGDDSTNPPDGSQASHEPMVAYIPLGKWRGRVKFRTVRQWTELVEWPDGKMAPRFKPLDE